MLSFFLAMAGLGTFGMGAYLLGKGKGYEEGLDCYKKDTQIIEEAVYGVRTEN